MTWRQLNLIALALATAGCSDARRAEYRPIRDRVTRIDWSGADVLVEADLANPLPTGARAAQFDYDVRVEGRPYATLNSSQPLDFPARGTATAGLPIRFDYAAIPGCRPGEPGRAELDYELSASIPVAAGFNETGANGSGANAAQIPVRYHGRFPVVRPPQFRVGHTDVDNDGYTSARIKLTVHVDNPNAFDIAAEQLGYEFRIGDLLVGNLRADTKSPIPARGAGKVKLVGRISATQVIAQLLSGGLDMRRARVVPTGTLSTPYGPLPLQR